DLTIGGDGDLGLRIDFQSEAGHRERALVLAVRGQDSHARVAVVGDVDPAFAVDRHSNGLVEFVGSAAALAPGGEFRPLQVELSHLVIAGVRQVDLTVGAGADSARAVERTTPFAQVFPFGGEDLDALVPGVGHVDVAVGADGNAARLIEFAGQLAALAP